MRKSVPFIFSVLAVIWLQSCREPSPEGGRVFEFSSGEVILKYDSDFRREIYWAPASNGGVVKSDTRAQEGISLVGQDLFVFPLESEPVEELITHPEFGPGKIVRIQGRERKESFDIRKRTEVFLPEQPSGAAIFQSWYENLGPQTVEIKKVYSQRIVLDRSAVDTGSSPYAFASYQGGAYHWGEDYTAIILDSEFQRSNFQGLTDPNGPEGEGGGLPLVDLWCPGMGVALAHLETKPQWLSLPVVVRDGVDVEVSILEEPDGELGQQSELATGEVYQTVKNAIIFHEGDYANALRVYGDLLRLRGVDIPRTSPGHVFAPYWKGWGFGMDFTVKQMIGVLPTLGKLGIGITNLDDGWFDFYGDWRVNKSEGKFPGGERDMVDYVSQVHRSGFKTNLWWYPLGVSPESKLASERPELLVEAKDGSNPKDSRGLYQLCPAYEPALGLVEELTDRFLGEWGFDGLYLDTSGLSAVPPCFNSEHDHSRPLDSFESIPAVFKRIYEVSRGLKPEPWLEVCICAAPHSPFNMPYYNIADASDPVNPGQARRRIRAEKAIRGGSFCVGDAYQVPIREWDGYSMPEDFESAMGTGAQLTTFFASLSAEQVNRWRRWFQRYEELELPLGEYLPLYDVAFERPEIHVIRKGETTYYGLYADYWPRNRAIELRGLEPSKGYVVEEILTGRELTRLEGSDPKLRVAFKGALLLQVRPRKDG